MRWAIIMASPCVGGGRPGQEKDEDKVSNDQPDRPLQMPPASTEVKEALDDFDRFQRRGAWERALKALYTIPEDQAPRFVDGENGFIIPVARKRRLVLAALSPAGQAAYRLFYDAEAKKLFDEAERPGRAEEPRADLLGLFHHVGRRQRGRPAGRPLLRARPISIARPTAGWRCCASAPTPISRPPCWRSRRRLALFRAGRRAEFEQVRPSWRIATATKR